MKLRLVCASLKSASAKLLALSLTERLGYKVYRSEAPKKGFNCLVYGDQKDKLTQYNYFLDNGLNFPCFTSSKELAQEWIRDFKWSIVCRTLLRAKGGAGIVIADKEDQLVDAPVYVTYRRKTNEYRVNIFKGSVVCVREKRLKKDYEKPEGRDGRIRNHNNGYVFCVPVDPVPQELIDTALAASKVTSSDFVGVDIAYHRPSNYHFLIEVNSAPGMEGLTVDEFASAIIKHYEDV